jgi:oligopeptide/dipeptide ABC transporter ATP-binding protein
LDNLLSIENLSVVYDSSHGRLTALDSVNLDIKNNELLAVVGESGCGKSTLGLSIIGLLPTPGSTIRSGSIQYKGTDLLKLDGRRIRRYRGTEVAMIFQEPLTSLNPVHKVGEQVADAIMVRELRKSGQSNVESTVMQKAYRTNWAQDSRLPRVHMKIPSGLRDEIVRYLHLVRIADPEQVLDRYPFELSGGMTQRVMIAMALSQEPALLIADEPTTALDVTTQAQVLKLMRELMDKVKTSILLVTHDLAVASQVADRIVVMYAGQIAEDTDAYSLFSEPLHPYTKGLLSCIPSGYKDESELKPISGTLPDLRNPPSGCRFTPRCPYAMQICSTKTPRLTSTRPNGHKVACFLYDQ